MVGRPWGITCDAQGSNDVGDDGAKAIAASLEVNTSLQALYCVRFLYCASGFGFCGRLFACCDVLSVRVNACYVEQQSYKQQRGNIDRARSQN